MVELPQWLINVGFSVVSGVTGWVLKIIWDAIQRLIESQGRLANELKSLELLVVGKYVTNEQFEKKMDAFGRKLDTIYDILLRSKGE